MICPQNSKAARAITVHCAPPIMPFPLIISLWILPWCLVPCKAIFSDEKKAQFKTHTIVLAMIYKKARLFTKSQVPYPAHQPSCGHGFQISTWPEWTVEYTTCTTDFGKRVRVHEKKAMLAPFLLLKNRPENHYELRIWSSSFLYSVPTTKTQQRINTSYFPFRRPTPPSYVGHNALPEQVPAKLLK